MNENADHENVQASSDSSSPQDAAAVRLQEYELWMRYAQADSDLVRHIYFGDYYPKPLEIICYHCQQAAEKSIKAVVVAYGAQGGMPKLHDLSFLLDQIKNMVEIDERYYDYADELTAYGVAVRYPSELGLEERHAKAALEQAGELLKWAKACCAEPESGETAE